MSSTDPPPLRFSDTRVLVRWGARVILPIGGLTVVLALLLPRPEPALAAGLGGSAAIVVVSMVSILRLRLPRVLPP